MIELQHC